MKKQFLWAALAAVTLLSTSCSNNDEPKSENEGNEVTFVIGGIATRTTTTFPALTTEFDNGDEIGIFGTGLQNEVTNEKLTYSGSSLSSSTIKFKDDETKASFIAYYPYQQSELNSFDFSVKTNQSTLDNFDGSDFLIATASEVEKGSTVTLNFSHKMALVKLTLDSGFTLEQDETISSITLNAIPTATCNLNTTPTVTASTNGTATAIQMYYDTQNSAYYCIIPAQTITGDGSSALLTITTSTRAFEYKFTGSKEFQAGQTHPIKIYNGSVFSFSSVSIAGWGTTATEDSWNVTEKEPEPEILLATQTFDETTITSAPNWNGATNAWSFVAGTNAEIEIGTDGNSSTNNALKLKRSSDVASSWAQCIAYYTIENPSNKLYKITFNAKTDNSATKGLCLSVCYSNTSNYVGIYKAPTSDAAEGTYYGMNQFNIQTGDNYKEYSAIINLDKSGTKRDTSTAIESTTNENDLSKIFLVLYPATGGGSNDVCFYIDNLKIEQIFTIE